MPNIQELSVGLRFTADTTAAKTELQSLKNILNNLTNMSTIDFNKTGLTAGINEAATAAAQLKVQLEAATNVKTGNLDLGKFNQSLKNTGTTLAQYKAQLERLGPEGQQAFFQLASSIQSAEIPLIRLNKVFNGLWENLKRTAGWQISSSMIHGFMSAVQKAYGYAQDLNESLNNIRIVTGQSVEQMAKFADQANKSAKALSTSTNEYAKASLIYYQQGLSDEAVKERTDVTIKMANVSGQAAETVSDQMTAVWNNFATGSEKLESYADKMVALGASTASSSEEIATGLEKFAAVADTVGLSFDYAAAALATVTAETRQSAETVGTAFKTLFARLEGLKMGETLDDGTDLNKYSAALASVGVNIKKANGELKDMDTILDETMDKWGSLSKDQQVALAQTVAGVRQYTQFIALMKNSDVFKENLETVAASEGALQAQADIYAESWEAAQKRVKASIETIYGELIDDEFFIKITNSIAKAVDGIGQFIKSIGGAKGVLLGLSTILLKIFNSQITNGIANMTMGIKNLVTQGKEGRDLQAQATVLATSSWQNQSDTEEGMAKATTYSKVAELQGILSKRANELSDTDLRINQMLIDRLKYLGQAVEKEAALVDKAKEEYETEKSIAKDQIDNLSRKDVIISKKKINNTVDQIAGTDEATGDINQLRKIATQMNISTVETKDGITSPKTWKQLREEIESTGSTLEGFKGLLNATVEVAGEAGESQGVLSEAIEQYRQALNAEEQAAINVSNAETALKTARENNNELEITENEARLAAAREDLAQASENAATAQELLTEAEQNCIQASTRAGAVLEEEVTNIKSDQKGSERLAKSKKLLETATESTSTAIKQQTKNLIKGTDAQKTYKTAMDKSVASGEKSGKATQKLVNINNSFSKTFDIIKTKVSSTAVMLQSYAKTFVSVASGASQLMMGLSSLSTIWDTIQDPDTSGWEKFKSVITSIGLGLPMLVSGISKVSGGVMELTGSLIANTAAGIANINAEQAGISLLTLVTTLRTAKKAATDSETESIAKQNAIKSLQIILEKTIGDEEKKALVIQALKNAGLKIEGKELEECTAAELAKAVADAVATGAMSPLVAITAVFGTTLGTVLLALLPYIAALGALVAVIALVVYAAGEQEREIKKAANTTKEAGEAAKASADRYKELKSSIESLNNAKETLKGLKEGTIEWYEAVVDLNNQILTLIKQYPALAGFVENVNGVLNIKQDGLNQVLQEQLLGTYNAQRQYESAQIAEKRIKKANGKEDTSVTEHQLANLLHNKINATSSFFNLSQKSANDIVSQFKNIIRATGTIDKNVLSYVHANKGYHWGSGLDQEDFNKYYEQILPMLEAIKTEVEEETLVDAETMKNLLLFSENQEKGRTAENLNAIQTFAAMSRVKEEQQTGNGYGYNGRAGRLANSTYVKSLEEQGYHTGYYLWDTVTPTGQLLGSTSDRSTKDKIASDWQSMKNAANDGYTYFIEGTGGRAFTAYREDTEGNRTYYQKDGSWGEKKTSDTVEYDDNLLEELAVFGDHITNEDIKVYEKYKAVMQNVTDQFKNGEISVEEYTKALKNNGEYTDAQVNAYLADVNMADQVEAQKHINILAKTSGIDVSELKTFVDSMDKEELKIFTAFEFDPDSKQNFYEQYKKFKSEFEKQQKENAIQLEAELGKSEGLESDEVKSYVQNLMDTAADETADNGNKLADSLKEDAKAAGVVARSVMHMNDGIEDLAKNQKEWIDILENSSETSEEYALTLGNIRKAMSKILDIDASYLSKDFLTNAENLELMKKAAEGDADAVDALKAKLRDEVIMKVIADNKIENSEELLAKHAALKERLENDAIKIGAVLDDEKFLDQAQALVDEAGMTVEQAQAYFDSLGYEAEIDTTEESLQSTRDITETAPTIRFSSVYWGDSKILGGVLKVPTITFESHKIGTEVENGTIEAASIGPVGKTEKPKIKKVIKKATGSMNNYSSSNAGGGSSSGKSGSEKTSKNVRDEIDRYHEVNAELSDLTAKMNELSTLKDRAWGGKRIAAIRAEQQVLEEYGDVLQQKLAEAEAYLREDASYLNAYGAIYDSEGRLLNSNEIITNAVNALKSGDIEEEEYNNIKTYISNYEDSLKNYKETMYNIAEWTRNKLDGYFEEVECTVEVQVEIDDKKIKYLEWLIDNLEDESFNQAAIISTASEKFDSIMGDWNAYTAGIKEILKVAGATEEDINNYLNGNVEAISQLENLTDEAIDDIENYTNGLTDTYNSLKELRTFIQEQLVSVYDEWNSKIEDQLDLMEHYDTILSHYQNIIDIIGADRLGLGTQNLINLSRSQVDYSINMVKTLKDIYATAEENLAVGREKLQKATTDADIKFWTDEVERLQKIALEAEANVYSSWEDTIQRAADLFTLTQERIFKDFEKSFSTVFDSFDEMLELLDQKKTLSSEYLPEYKKIYELNKLNRNLNKEIEKTNNLAITKKLKNLQDEINDKMREGVKLSEYDLQYLQKKYDLRLAEIALEDAQIAKTTVRLQKDSSGNYGYVYTANEEAVENSIQDYEDKLFAAQDYTETYLDELSNSYAQTMSDMINALSQLDKNDKNYREKAEKIKTYYVQRLQYYGNEIGKALGNNQDLYDEDLNYINQYYTSKENRQRSYLLDFKSTLIGGLLDGFDTIEDATQYLVTKIGSKDDPNSLIGQNCQAQEEMFERVDEILGLMGFSIDDFAETLDEKIYSSDGINNKILSIATATQEMADLSKSDYDKAASAISDFQKQVSPVLDQLCTDTKDFNTAYLELIENLQKEIPEKIFKVGFEMDDIPDIPANPNAGGGGAGGGGAGGGGAGGGGAGGGDPSGGSVLKTPEKKLLYSKYVWKTNLKHQKILYYNTGPEDGEFLPHVDKYKNNSVIKICSDCNHVYYGVADQDFSYISSASTFLQNQTGIALEGWPANEKQIEQIAKVGISLEEIKTLSNGNFNKDKINAKNTAKKIKKRYEGKTDITIWDIINNIGNLDTGGYTGDWGPDGRLAMLHEKELVLNKKDTANILSTVDFVRQLSQTIDLQGLLQFSRNITAPNFNNSSDINKNQNISQEIHIDASFPGVTTREEIEQAFGELALQASQYINKYETQY